MANTGRPKPIDVVDAPSEKTAIDILTPIGKNEIKVLAYAIAMPAPAEAAKVGVVALDEEPEAFRAWLAQDASQPAESKYGDGLAANTELEAQYEKESKAYLLSIEQKAEQLATGSTIPAFDNPKGRAAFDNSKGRDQLFCLILQNELEEEKLLPIEDSLAKGDYVQAIQRLNLEKDEASGIHSRYQRIQSTNELVLVRDATNQREFKPTYHNWAIMGLNAIAATKKFIDIHRKNYIFDDSCFSELNNLSKKFFEAISKSSDPELEMGRMIHSELIPLLITKSSLSLNAKEIEKQLLVIRDFCNFDHETAIMVTDTKVQLRNKPTVSFRHIDVPMTGGLSDNLKRELNEIETKNVEDIKNIPWFCEQAPLVKELIKMHAKDISACKMIPTQLRKYLPGLRNTGEERVYDLGTKDCVYSGYHSPTPSHALSKQARVNQEATNETVAQLQTVTGGKDIYIHTLLSPVNRAKRQDGFSDANLVTQVSRAIENKANPEGYLSHSNIPLNPLRSISLLDRVTNFFNFILGISLEPNFKADAFEKIYQRGKKVLSNLRKDANSIPRIIKAKEQMLVKQLNLLENQKYKNEPLIAYYKDEIRKHKEAEPQQKENLKQIKKEILKLKTLLNAYENLIKGSDVTDPENVNLQLSSVVSNLVHQINNHVPPAEKIVLLRGCRSAKDREGVARMQSINDAVQLHLEVRFATKNPLTPKEVLRNKKIIQRAFLNAGHVREYAGQVGGTLGAGGIKKDSRFVIPKSWGDVPVIETTASFNKKFPKDRSKAKPFYKNWKFYAGVIGVGAAIALSFVGVGVLVGIVALAAKIGAGVVGVGGVTCLSKTQKENAVAKRVARARENDAKRAQEAHIASQSKGHLTSSSSQDSGGAKIFIYIGKATGESPVDIARAHQKGLAAPQQQAPARDATACAPATTASGPAHKPIQNGLDDSDTLLRMV